MFTRLSTLCLLILSSACQVMDVTTVAAKYLPFVPHVGFFCICRLLANCEGINKTSCMRSLLEVCAKLHGNFSYHFASVFLLTLSLSLPPLLAVAFKKLLGVLPLCSSWVGCLLITRSSSIEFLLMLSSDVSCLKNFTFDSLLSLAHFKYVPRAFFEQRQMYSVEQI